MADEIPSTSDAPSGSAPDPVPVSPDAAAASLLSSIESSVATANDLTSNTLANEITEARHAAQTQRELEQLERHLELVTGAEAVRLSKTACPRNHFYDHHRYYFQWFDDERQAMRTTQTTEFCSCGLCHLEATAEYELWQEQLRGWHRLHAARQRLGMPVPPTFEKPSESSPIAVSEEVRMLDAVDAVSNTLAEELAAEAGTDVAPQSRFWFRPEQPTTAAWLTADERLAQKRRIIEAIHNGSIPNSLTTAREDGQLWLTQQPGVLYTSVVQLLSADDLEDADIWKEIIRQYPDQITLAPQSVLSSADFFRWMIEESREGLRAALPVATPAVLGNREVMTALLETDWLLARRFANDSLRSDPEFAISAIKRFQQDVAATTEWLGPEPRDNPDVMATAVEMSAHAIRSASTRLRGDVDFARRVLTNLLNTIDAGEQYRRGDTWATLEAVLDRFSEVPLDDEEAMRTAMLIDGRALRHCSERIRNDKLLMMNVIDEAAERFPAERSTAVCIWLCRSLPDNLRDDEELAIKAIEVCSGQEIMDCWSERLRGDREFVLRALSRSVFRRRMLAALPEDLRDDEGVVQTALQADGSAILSASERLRHSKRFLRRAMSDSTSGDSLNTVLDLAEKLFGGHLPAPLRERDKKTFVANRQIINIADLPEELRDDQEMVVTALEFGSPLKGTSERLLNDPNFALKAIEAYGRRSAIEEIRNEMSERVMEDLGQRVKDNQDVMLAAVERDGSLVRYASERLRNQPSFAVEAINSAVNPELVLQELPSKIRDNERVMSTAAEMNPRLALRFASERLKQDRRFSQKIQAAIPDRATNANALKTRPNRTERKQRRTLLPTEPEPRDTRKRSASSSSNSIDFTMLAGVGMGGLIIGTAVYSVFNGVGNVVYVMGAIVLVVAALLFVVRRAPTRTTGGRGASSNSDSPTSRRTEDVRYDRDGHLEQSRRNPKTYVDRIESDE